MIVSCSQVFVDKLTISQYIISSISDQSLDSLKRGEAEVQILPETGNLERELLEEMIKQFPLFCLSEKMKAVKKCLGILIWKHGTGENIFNIIFSQFPVVIV